MLLTESNNQFRKYKSLTFSNFVAHQIHFILMVSLNNHSIFGISITHSKAQFFKYILCLLQHMLLKSLGQNFSQRGTRKYLRTIAILNRRILNRLKVLTKIGLNSGKIGKERSWHMRPSILNLQEIDINSKKKLRGRKALLLLHLIQMVAGQPSRQKNF